MRSRRDALGLTAGAVAFAGLGGRARAQAPRRATAITQVFGDGQKLTAVALEYDQPIDGTRLTPNTFAVEGRTVTHVYAGAAAEPGARAATGHYAIIELSPADPGAALLVQAGRTHTRKAAATSVVQVGPVVAVSGKVYSADPTPVATTAARNLIVDDFEPLEFADPETGDRLRYNLFKPRDYDPAKTYPLVLFMHDAGTTSTVTDTTLVQGLGAVVWASPAEQAKHAAFVLAPQYARVVVNDQSEATSDLDTTIHLVEHLASRYSIDRDRLYATGQSGGAMMSIAMNIKYPGLFAASLIVAGQWDPALVRPLAKDKLWIIVSQGDLKAYPGENAITAVLEGEGAKVARAVWDGDATPEQFAADVAKVRAQGAPIQYVALRKGTVVPAGQPDDGGGNHVNTWRIAYGIEGVRDWLFEQRR
jgi:predicted peptidase